MLQMALFRNFIVDAAEKTSHETVARGIQTFHVFKSDYFKCKINFMLGISLTTLLVVTKKKVNWCLKCFKICNRASKCTIFVASVQIL